MFEGLSVREERKASWVAGGPGTGFWMHAMLVLVLALGAVHGMLSAQRNAFERGDNQKSEKYFRVLNEAPTVLMIAIVLLVVVKFI